VKEIVTQIEIGAPVARVWQVITDLPRWSEWNPLMKASGVPEAGSRIAIEVALPGRKPVRFKPRITVLQPNVELRWRGHMFVPGLFDGEHGFLLSALGPKKCHLDHFERFNGLLVARLLDEKAIRLGFTAMNRALKREAEKGG
jgi:hypothetical protein